MESVFRIFNVISYLKYPLLLLGVYFVYKPMLVDSASMIADYNHALMVMGIAISLDSLKDYRKLNWLDRQVYHRPRVARFFFLSFGLLLLSIMGTGIYGYFKMSAGAIQELSIGMLLFGIGCIGLLKTGMETTKDYMEKREMQEASNLS